MEDMAGNLPGAPKVRILASNAANSGACASGAKRAFISVSRASLLLLKSPSLLFGFGAGTGAGGGATFGFGAAGAGLGCVAFVFVTGSS